MTGLTILLVGIVLYPVYILAKAMSAVIVMCLNTLRNNKD